MTEPSSAEIESQDKTSAMQAPGGSVALDVQVARAEALLALATAEIEAMRHSLAYELGEICLSVRYRPWRIFYAWILVWWAIWRYYRPSGGLRGLWAGRQLQRLSDRLARMEVPTRYLSPFDRQSARLLTEAAIALRHDPSHETLLLRAVQQDPTEPRLLWLVLTLADEGRLEAAQSLWNNIRVAGGPGPLTPALAERLKSLGAVIRPNTFGSA